MNELHLTPEDLPGARRVLAHLQRLLKEASGYPASTPTPYQSTLGFLIEDLQGAIRRPGPANSWRHGQLARNGSCSADPTAVLELYLLWLIRRRRMGFGL